VDGSRTDDNITFVKQPISEAYEECFGDAVQRYNEKQSRADRQIKDSYYQSVFDHTPSNTVITSSDKRKSFYEDLVQIGTKDDTGVGTADGKLATVCLSEYMQGFSERNPNMYVFNAVLHQDEATPHLHIDYIPIGHYKRGIDTQNGLAQALKEMGYTGKDAISKWRISERHVLENICKAHKLEISEPKQARGYSYTPDEYKTMKDEIVDLQEELIKEKKQVKEIGLQKNTLESDVQALQATLKPLRELNTIANQSAVEGQKMPFSKRLVSENEFTTLNEQKKAAIVTAADQQQLAIKFTTISAELSERERKLSKKEDDIEQMTCFIKKEQESATSLRLWAERKLQEAEKEPYIQYLKSEIKDYERVCNKFAKENTDLQKKNIELNKKNIALRQEIEPITKQNSNQSESIRVLEQELTTVKSENQELVNTYSSKIDKLTRDVSTYKGLYDKAFECGQYIADRIGYDFDDIVDKRIDGYGLSYIMGDKQSRER